MDTITTERPQYEARREAMVESQLRTNAVNDPRVVVAMAKVARERYLPFEKRELAYLDRAIPWHGGRSVNPPMPTGRLLTEAYLTPLDRVLLIGAAGGYAAALLAELVREIVAVEVDPAMAAFAREALADRPAVTLVEGPLAAGHPQGAPYDVLIIDGAVEDVPASLIEQLKPGGRITTGIHDRTVTRLAAGARSPHGFGLTSFADAECVILPGFAKPRGFTF